MKHDKINECILQDIVRVLRDHKAGKATDYKALRAVSSHVQRMVEPTPEHEAWQQEMVDYEGSL